VIQLLRDFVPRPPAVALFLDFTGGLPSPTFDMQQEIITSSSGAPIFSHVYASARDCRFSVKQGL